MKITFVNNDGGGGTRQHNAPDGVSVIDFVRQQMPRFSSDRYQVRVNRESAGPGTILQDGDHVAVMPAKVGGGY
jgi:molybdopterin converting factor small subunit